MEQVAQLQQIAQLAPTGEVAQFIDDDQFGLGQSVEKCGYEVVSLFWHSVAVGKPNPYKAFDVHKMASDDYQGIAGPDTASNQNGMTLQELYADLQKHRFSYKPLPLSLEYIFAWLKYGYPVILAVTEDSVYDMALKAKPYAWNTNGLTHIILATGIAKDGNLLCRDTANVQAPGLARPGPRVYQAAKLSLISCTLVVPSWLPVPPTGFDPRGNTGGTTSVTHPVNLAFQATIAERQLWQLGSKAATFNDQWAIVHSWILHYRAGKWLGIPLESEQQVTLDGVMYKEQAFTAAYARWDSKKNVVSWIGPMGEIK